jgi:signal transduction histidine kinase
MDTPSGRSSPENLSPETISRLAELAAAGTTAELADEILDIVRRSLQADFAAFVRSEPDFTYRVVHARGHRIPKTIGTTQRLGYTVISRALEARESLSTRVGGASQGQAIDEWISAEGISDVLVEPVASRMGTVGAIIVGYRQSLPSPAQLSGVAQTARALAKFLGMVLETREIVSAARQQAYHAELLNSLLSKARRAPTAEKILAETASVLGRGLKASRVLICMTSDSSLSEEQSLQGVYHPLGTSERPSAAAPSPTAVVSLEREGQIASLGIVSEYAAPDLEPIFDPSHKRVVAGSPSRFGGPKDSGDRAVSPPERKDGGAALDGAPESPRGPGPMSEQTEIRFESVRPFLEMAAELLERTPEPKGLASKERTQGGAVEAIPPGRLRPHSPPGFAIVLSPSSGGPYCIVGIKREADGAISASEERFLERVAEELSHVLAYAGAFAAEREAVKRLVELDKTKSELLSVVSHELRTPLTSIRGFASSLLESFDDLPADKRRRMLEIIDDQAQRLAKLIDDFLDMSRLQEGRVSLDLSLVDLFEIVSGVISRHAAQAAKRGMSVSATERARQLAGKAVVQADESKVDQIVTNLVGNALKYGEGEVTVDIWPEGDGYCVAVEDEGPGVPPDKQQAIFERFVQADSSSTRRSSGVGLGLAIARGLAEAHGGSLWYEDREPRGARFVLFLPTTQRVGSVPRG